MSVGLNPQPIGAFLVGYAGTVGLRDYYRVAKQTPGASDNRTGEQVSVRVGMHGVFVCLTCRATACAHAEAARDYATQFPPPREVGAA